MYAGMDLRASTHHEHRCYMELSSQVFAPECYAWETAPHICWIADWVGRLSGPQCWSEHDGEKENPSLFREFEAYHLACSQLLYRLSYSALIVIVSDFRIHCSISQYFLLLDVSLGILVWSAS
jgi:hypothetical protein